MQQILEKYAFTDCRISRRRERDNAIPREAKSLSCPVQKEWKNYFLRNFTDRNRDKNENSSREKDLFYQSP